MQCLIQLISSASRVGAATFLHGLQPVLQNVRWVTPYPPREVSDARRYQTRGAEGAYARGGGAGAGQEDR